MLEDNGNFFIICIWQELWDAQYKIFSPPLFYSSIVFPHASHNLFPYTIFKFIINFMELEVVVARLLLFY